ncbi:AIPR family protein [bacterium]|nr:AIPR family protein [bacterium]
MKNEIFYDIIDEKIDELSSIFKDNEHLKKQDVNGKKSFSFLLWFLNRYLPNHDLSEFEDLITEGNDDSSCDLIFTNKDQLGNEIYYVVQAKWFAKSNINKAKEITKEIKACLSDFRLIMSGKKESEHNEKFNSQYKKFISHKRNNGKVKFVFLALCNGEIDINEHIADFKSPLVSFELIDFFKLKQQFVEIEYKGIKTHNPIETPYIPKSEFDLEFEKEQVITNDKPHPSHIFLVKPREIYTLFEKYGHSLFYKNIRNPLPSSLFNEGIKETILKNSINFWYFNNGITAITDKIDYFHPDSTCVKIKGIQVINGAQTVYSIFEAYKNATDDERSKMDEYGLITLRTVTTGGDDFDLKVTRYTNSQNPISERDFHSNDEVQKRLQFDFLKHTNVWYETRRGEFRKKIKGITKLTNEILGQNYLAYFINDPFNAKQNKKLIFVSKTIQSNGLYEVIFNEETKFDDMLLSYYLNLLVDRKRKEFKSKIDAVDTNALKDGEAELLKFDFIQYANYEIMALFKTLFYNVNADNIKGVSGKAITYFEKDTIDRIENGYQFIIKFILSDLENRKKTDSKIVNSVLFKNKEFYPTLKKDFIEKLNSDKFNSKDYKL